MLLPIAPGDEHVPGDLARAVLDFLARYGQ
jgi:hypothetical protein